MKAKLVSVFIKFRSSGFPEYCFVGFINTLTNAAISSLTHRVFLQENIAAVLGYLISLSIGFFLSCKIIFYQKPSFKYYFMYMISYIPNFIIFFLVTFITINTMELPQFWGTVLASMVGGPITYVIMRIYAFGSKNPLKK